MLSLLKHAESWSKSPVEASRIPNAIALGTDGVPAAVCRHTRSRTSRVSLCCCDRPEDEIDFRHVRSSTCDQAWIALSDTGGSALGRRRRRLSGRGARPAGMRRRWRHAGGGHCRRRAGHCRMDRRSQAAQTASPDARFPRSAQRALGAACVPRSLHGRLAAVAKREGVSLNALVTAILAEGLGQRSGRSGPIEESD